MLLEGVFTAATSCFDTDGKLFLHKLERNIERYSRTAVSGLVILGSTGEAVMLGDGESCEVLRHAAQAAASEKVLIAGIGRESLTETLRLAEYAARQEYDAVLVRTPHFYRPQLRSPELLNYYRMVADRSPLPVLLYSVPAYTLYDLPIDVIGELAQHPNIIGIKDSSGKVDRITELVRATSQVKKRTVRVTQTFAAVTSRMLKNEADVEALVAGSLLQIDQVGSINVALPAAPMLSQLKTRTREVGFQVLAGSAQTVSASLHAGATGAVLAMAAFAPQSCAEIYMAWKDKDAVLEQEKQHRLLPAATRICGEMGVPGVKYACEINGYFGGMPRLPLLPLTAVERQEVSSLLSSIGS